VPFGLPGTNFKGTVNSKKFTPRASVSFKPADGQNFYVSYAQGFKGSGFDPRGAGANAPDLNGNGVREDAEIAAFLSFDAETVDSYEIGYKASLLDRRLNLALAAFRADYSDVQIPGSEACTINGLPSFCGTVTNAGKARFQGFEAEVSTKVARSFARPGDALTLSGSLGYIDAQFREYITNIAGKGPVDVAEFREVQNTPKWTASGTLAYDTPVGAGSLNFNTTVAYRSKTFQFEIPQPLLDQPGFALWDANLVYRSDDDRWSVGLHGKNLTNKRYVTSGYPFLAADPVTGALVKNAQGEFVAGLGREGVATQYYGNPRQVFLSFGVKF
jgi:iron complex outermembrane receptor protein